MPPDSIAVHWPQQRSTHSTGRRSSTQWTTPSSDTSPSDSVDTRTRRGGLTWPLRHLATSYWDDRTYTDIGQWSGGHWSASGQSVPCVGQARWTGRAGKSRDSVASTSIDREVYYQQHWDTGHKPATHWLTDHAHQHEDTRRVNVWRRLLGIHPAAQCSMTVETSAISDILL